MTREVPAPPSLGRKSGAPAVGLTLLVAVVVSLHLAGGPVPAPPLTAPSRWATWASGRDPVAVAFTVVRIVALTAAWYALTVTIVGVALRLVAAPGPASVVDRLTVVPLRRLVATTVAVVVSAGPLSGAGATTIAQVPPTSAPSSAEPSATIPGGGPPVTVTMHLETPAADPTPGPPAAVTPGDVPTDDRADPVSGSWTVRPGQCFWSIADDVLTDKWDRPPTDAEIVPYWRRLIEANRDRLSDPHNPDLIFAGQVFALPEA